MRAIAVYLLLSMLCSATPACDRYAGAFIGILPDSAEIERDGFVLSITVEDDATLYQFMEATHFCSVADPCPVYFILMPDDRVIAQQFEPNRCTFYVRYDADPIFANGFERHD
jgi:hypothetical protein